MSGLQAKYYEFNLTSDTLIRSFKIHNVEHYSMDWGKNILKKIIKKRHKHV